MFFKDFIVSDNINIHQFTENLKCLKRVNFPTKKMANVDNIIIDENHYSLLKCKTAQEIIDKNFHHFLNDKISLPFHNEQTQTIYKVSFSFFQVLFSAKNELRESLFNLMNENLKKLFNDIQEIPFDSGSKETSIRKKIISLNCPLINNYLTIKNNRDYLKLFLTDSVITQNPYLILLFVAPFENYKFSQYISIFTNNDLLQTDISKYCLSPFNLFRLNDDIFDDKFILFLKNQNLFNVTRDYNFNAKNLKFQTSKKDQNQIKLNLADHFYLKGNKFLAFYLESKGLSINFDFHLVLDLHKNILVEENNIRGETNKKLIERIASLENLIIKGTTDIFLDQQLIKKRL